jgi:pyruvate/2-oxoglutarate dehydrogenase complex dihydrolipoamide acyltransferase (E2) component
MTREHAARRYRLVSYPRHRQAVLDVLAVASRQYTVHGLVEVDVTEARRRLRGSEPGSSFTAFVVATVARAVREHPQINARRVGRRLLLFDEVDAVVTVERPLDGTPTPLPTILRHVGTRSYREITADIRAAKQRPVNRPGDLTGNKLLAVVPPAIRRLAIRVAGRVPAAAVRFAPPIGISSLGMFGTGGGWGIPLSPMTLMVTVGGIVRRLALIDGLPVEREMLPLTLSFDHAVVDGAPAARFAATLRQLFETADALQEDGATDDATAMETQLSR